jgi:hypothetical protein
MKPLDEPWGMVVKTGGGFEKAVQPHTDCTDRITWIDFVLPNLEARWEVIAQFWTTRRRWHPEYNDNGSTRNLRSEEYTK